MGTRPATGHVPADIGAILAPSTSPAPSVPRCPPGIRGPRDGLSHELFWTIDLSLASLVAIVRGGRYLPGIGAGTYHRRMPRGRRLRILPVIVLLAFLGMTAAIVHGYSQARHWQAKSVTQNRLAVQWRDRAEALTGQVASSSRSVSDLRARQGTLAQEKAALEDERVRLRAETDQLRVNQTSLQAQGAALTDLVKDALTCNHALTERLDGRVASGEACGQLSTKLDAYVKRYER